MNLVASGTLHPVEPLARPLDRGPDSSSPRCSSQTISGKAVLTP